MDAESSWQVLETFLSGEMSAADFEQWLSAASELESLLGTRAYRELLAFDFRQANVAQELFKHVRSIYEYARPGRLARDRAFRIARGLLSGSIRIHDGVRALAELCLDGHDWVPGIFVQVNSEFDEIPGPDQYDRWEPSVLGAKLEEGRRITRLRRPAVLDAAREIISSYRKEYGGGQTAIG
jgi:hypothetical protein